MLDIREAISRVAPLLDEGKRKGDEILPRVCPICGGGKHKDQYTFALNTITGASNCMRGSCGWTGSIKQLADHLGVDLQMDYFREVKIKKTYKKPEVIHHDLTKGIVDYFKTRGISQETLIKNRVSSDKNGNIAFNYYLDGELTFIKYKVPRKQRIIDGKKERKSWREKDTKPILYGMDECDPKLPLIIVEGEPDKLVLDECGIKNATSIPSGTKENSWIETHWEWLEQFSEIVLWSDNDKAGKEFLQTVIPRLDDWRLKVVKSIHKDANVCLHKEGVENVKNTILGAMTISKQYITDLANVKRKDYKDDLAISTGFECIDKLIGGFYPGQLVVWTGWNGSGKSTLLSQIMLNGIEKYKTFCYSGELSKDDFKEWMDLQLCGSKYIDHYYCSVKKQNIPIPNEKYYDLLDDYYRDRLFLFDSEDYATSDDILKAIKYMAKREGTKVFMIDNLMTVPVKGREDANEKTTKFIIQLKKFARTFGVVVHLVAHPRKPATGQVRVDKYSIAGTANVTNLADRAIDFHRLKQEEKEKDEVYSTYSNVMTIFKDRKFGVFDKELLFRFSAESKRYYTENNEDKKEYSWTDSIDKFTLTDEKAPWDD